MSENKLISVLPQVQVNVELKKYTTISLGGKAKYLITVKDLRGLIDAISAARSLAMPYRVIGFGSNLLISDKGFDGLVIINRSNSLQVDKTKSMVISDGGVSLSKLILEAATNGLSGMEQMFGIPGTVAGAISVNAGAHEVSVSKFLKSATIMLSSDKIVSVNAEWFNFEYRSSRLKYKKDDFPPVILSAIFQFGQKRTQDILEEINKYKQWREKNQPVGEKTCGSVFKNPSRSHKQDEKESSAGFLLDDSGAKKLKVGSVKVSKRHANWIINDGRGTALDARMLIEQMRGLVLDKYGVSLEEEIEYLGDWS